MAKLEDRFTQLEERITDPKSILHIDGLLVSWCAFEWASVCVCVCVSVSEYLRLRACAEWVGWRWLEWTEMCVGGGVGSVLVNMMNSQRGGLAGLCLVAEHIHVGVQVLWWREMAMHCSRHENPSYPLQNTNLNKHTKTLLVGCKVIHPHPLCVRLFVVRFQTPLVAADNHLSSYVPPYCVCTWPY